MQRMFCASLLTMLSFTLLNYPVAMCPSMFDIVHGKLAVILSAFTATCWIGTLHVPYTFSCFNKFLNLFLLISIGFAKVHNSTSSFLLGSLRLSQIYAVQVMSFCFVAVYIFKCSICFMPLLYSSQSTLDHQKFQHRSMWYSPNII